MRAIIVAERSFDSLTNMSYYESEQTIGLIICDLLSTTCRVHDFKVLYIVCGLQFVLFHFTLARLAWRKRETKEERQFTSVDIAALFPIPSQQFCRYEYYIFDEFSRSHLQRVIERIWCRWYLKGRTGRKNAWFLLPLWLHSIEVCLLRL